MKLYLSPSLDKCENGGIRRVIEAQHRYLPSFGIELVSDPMQADVEACHVIGRPQNPKIPFVLHNHGMMWSEYHFPQWAEKVNRDIVESMRYADVITSPSEWVTRALARGVSFPIETIYHGVDTTEWQPIPVKERSGYILWNKARVDEVCDPSDMQMLAQRLPELSFYTTFGKPSSNVFVIGQTSNKDMRTYLQKAGLYLVTSRETFGIGTLEALACGIPVVGWDYGGQSEIILPYQTGILVPYRDFDALAQAVQEILKHYDEYAERARQDAVQRWGWKDKIAKYADIYWRLHKENSSPRPKVTVVVPCYNLGRFLPYTLKSIQNQTLSDFECLIIDDCSTDRTPDIAKACAEMDNRFQYIRNPKNVGLSEVRNIGAARARGTYLIYVDSDDMLPENALELLATALDRDRSIHIAYGSLDVISEDGTHRRRNVFPQEFNWYHQMAHQNQIPTAAMMRRRVALQNHGWRVRQWRAEDAEFWSRVTSFGYRARKVTEETTLLYRSRYDGKSATEYRENPDHDGNWLANLAWRSANTREEGREYIQHHGNTVPHPEIVPFGADAEPPTEKFWNVSHGQSPEITVVIRGTENLLDTLDSLMGQYMTRWDVWVIGSPVPAPAYVRFIKEDQHLPKNHILVKSGDMFPSNWLLPERIGSLQTTKVLLQYQGKHSGNIPFRVNGRTYIGYKGAIIEANPMDTSGLLATGRWKIVATNLFPEPALADQRR